MAQPAQVGVAGGLLELVLEDVARALLLQGVQGVVGQVHLRPLPGQPVVGRVARLLRRLVLGPALPRPRVPAVAGLGPVGQPQGRGRPVLVAGRGARQAGVGGEEGRAVVLQLGAAAVHAVRGEAGPRSRPRPRPVLRGRGHADQRPAVPAVAAVARVVAEGAVDGAQPRARVLRGEQPAQHSVRSQHPTSGWSPVSVWLLAEAGPGDGVRAVGEAVAVLPRVGPLLPLQLPAHPHAAHGLRQVSVPATTPTVSYCILHDSRPMVQS